MAAGEVTGADQSELEQMEADHLDSPLYKDHNIPFEVAYCLNKIGKQPDEYDGPQRYCKKRVVKKNEEDYEGCGTDKEAFAVSCKPHGGDLETSGKKTADTLENPLTAGIKHGAHADDKHLRMDFDEHEQDLYDEIMEDWPEIYDWPDKSEDPARYRILRRVAVNEVRALREEDYLDDHEVHVEEIPTEAGVQEKEVENPLAREYRLLMSEVTNQMKELGLTPKERQKMDTMEAQEEKDDAITQIADDALGGDGEYDPDQFDE